MKANNKYILWFKQVDKDDIPLVGGKGANLGEMASFDIPVPNGFIVTSKAYFDFLEENQLRYQIAKQLESLDSTNPETYSDASLKIKKLIREGRICKELAAEIIKNYLSLGRGLRQALVAIRSSATAEDLPTASFAGQQVTFLNIQGEARVVELVKECWASLFEPRAIFYRHEKGFDHLKVGIAVPVQEMVPAQISGVMFTIDPVSNDKKTMVIEAIYGLGEMIVQGQVTPDRYLVDKADLEIMNVFVSKQIVQLIKVGDQNRERPVPKSQQEKRKLSDSQIKELAKIGKKIHQHYFFPQDIEWCFFRGKFWVLQTRPVTTIKPREKNLAESPEQAQLSKRKSILKGVAASPGIVSGPVRLIKSAKQINQVRNGEVLVTSMTTPDFVPAMKKAVAIVTDRGGQTSHAAIVSRELGIPCIVGTENATAVLKNEQMVTINGVSGEIYSGGLIVNGGNRLTKFRPGKFSKNDLSSSAPVSAMVIRTATKIYVNLAEKELAKEVSLKNVDGIGLLRAEFMMAEIGIHPKKIIKEKKQKLFIDMLSSSLSVFCQAFAPRPVVYRTTDFKTNEYRHLDGGSVFEPEEENPMIGFRGAFRYLANPEVFLMELAAIKAVRNKMDLRNLWLMVPFCRTPRELIEVKKLIASAGLIRSPSFKLWLMVEIPSNVILLEEFIKIGIDGVSIGSNDLTMLLLGVDRDNSELAKDFNEQDPAVLWAIEKTVKTCLKHKISSSICGQAPSAYPDLVARLIEWGITSLSVNPDAIERTREYVYELEKDLVKKNG